MSEQPIAVSFPRPSKALTILMIAIACLWVMFAVALNWGGASGSVSGLLIGSSEGLLSGQVWRLLTAPLIHDPGEPLHMLLVLLMLYFFVPQLEERWGSLRMYLFLFGCAAFAFVVESLLHLVAPSLASANWYGATVMVDAAIVAWAFAHRDQVIRLFFVLPMKPLMVVGLTALWHVVLVIARKPGSEGLFAPFGAMLAGWLFCDSGPGRRAWLRFKLRRLQNEADSLARKRKAKRRAAPHLRVIRGGADDDDERMLH